VSHHVWCQPVPLAAWRLVYAGRARPASSGGRRRARDRLRRGPDARRAGRESDGGV